MKPLSFDSFDHIWVIDFEFIADPGEIVIPVCLVAKELVSGQVERLWLVGDIPPPAFLSAPNSLIVTYFGSAEMGCLFALDWPLPTFHLDLFAEFRNHTNGLNTIAGNGLLGALAHYGLAAIAPAEKESMRNLILKGGPWTVEEEEAILDYCQADVEATAKLFMVMRSYIDLPRALLRGRYMKAVAAMENTGVPTDTEMLWSIRANWEALQHRLVEEVDQDYEVYEGLTFKQTLFENYLNRNGIHWPRLESGKLNLQDDTFKDMAKKYPQLQPLRELRSSLSQLRLNNLAVGSDARNRCLLSPFSSKTSRNQPSNAKFIFGPAVWLRFLIKPKPGMTIAYIDWSQQEFGIENINKQLLLGKSREQLAKLYGHKSWKTVDMFMRRKNYFWNGDKQVYEIKAKRPKEEDSNEEQTGSKRVRQVLKSFKEGKDAKIIAKELGFKNHLALAEFMKDKGYLWDHQESCYQFRGSGIDEQEAGNVYPYNVDIEMEDQSQQFLEEREQLGGNNKLPRYSLAGLRVAKTMQFSNNLNQLLLNFTADKNINQREFFEIAAIEMMKKYGYEAEIKGLLG